MSGFKPTRSERVREKIEAAYRLQMSRRDREEQETVAPCRRHPDWLVVLDGRQPPSPEMCPACLRENERTRTEPAPEVRKVTPPELAPLSPRLELLWMRRQAAQEGPLPGSSEEFNAIEAIDHAREDALAEEKAKAQGRRRHGGYACSRIIDGVWVDFVRPANGRGEPIQVRP